MKLCCVALPNSKYSTKYTKYTENIGSIWPYNRDKVPLFNIQLKHKSIVNKRSLVWY